MVFERTLLSGDTVLPAWDVGRRASDDGTSMKSAEKVVPRPLVFEPFECALGRSVSSMYRSGIDERLLPPMSGRAGDRGGRTPEGFCPGCVPDAMDGVSPPGSPL